MTKVKKNQKKDPVRKKTTIGNSVRSRPRNKSHRLSFKKRIGQGKP